MIRLNKENSNTVVRHGSNYHFILVLWLYFYLEKMPFQHTVLTHFHITLFCSFFFFYICLHMYRKIIWKPHSMWAVTQYLETIQSCSSRDVYSRETHHIGMRGRTRHNSFWPSHTHTFSSHIRIFSFNTHTFSFHTYTFSFYAHIFSLLHTYILLSHTYIFTLAHTYILLAHTCIFTLTHTHILLSNIYILLSHTHIFNLAHTYILLSQGHRKSLLKQEVTLKPGNTCACLAYISQTQQNYAMMLFKLILFSQYFFYFGSK